MTVKLLNISKAPYEISNITDITQISACPSILGLMVPKTYTGATGLSRIINVGSSSESDGSESGF